MRQLHVGDRVVHPELGAGRVLKRVAGGRVRVRFDASSLLPRTVEIGRLHPAAGNGADAAGFAPEAPAVEIPAPRRRRPRRATPGGGRPPRVAVDRDTAGFRQTLEALRTGVVPAAHVEDYTVGRTREVESLQALLAAGRGLRLLWGDYGAGKTHLLDLAEQAGRRAGFVTARAVLNPLEVPPTHPKRLYRACLLNLRYPDTTETGWRPLLEKLAASPDHAEPGGAAYSRFFSPVVFALRSGNEEAIAWAADYIEGYRMDAADVTRALRAVGWRGDRLLALSDFRTYGRMYVHMMGTLACWARDAGHRGLLLLMDEVEYVDGLCYDHFVLAAEVLMHYAAATLPEASLAFEVEDLYRGGHPVHRAIDLCFRPDQPLAVVMAFTPLGAITGLAGRIVQDEAASIWLRALGRRDFARLVERVVALYRRGYPAFDPDPDSVSRLRAGVLDAFATGEESPREAVRTTVSVLDCLRYGRDPFDGHPSP